MNIKVDNLKGKIYGGIRIKEEIFKNPLWEISITGRDLNYQGYTISRAFLLLDGKDLSNLRVRNLSFKMGEDYLVASGKWNLLKMSGEVNGNLQLRGDLDYLLSFSWKGDLNSWKSEIIPRGTRLTWKKNFSIYSPKGSISFDSRGNILGEIRADFLKGTAKVKIIGKDWKWEIYGKGENLEEFLKSVEFELNNDLSFKGNLLMDYSGNPINLELEGLYKDEKVSGSLVLQQKSIGDFKGKFEYNLNNFLKISDIYYSDIKIGNISLDFDSQGFNIKGDILDGRVLGRYNFNNKGIISFLEVSINSLIKNFDGRINGDIFLEEIVRFNIGSKEITYQNIKAKNLDIKGKIKDGIYFDSFSFSLFEDLKLLGRIYIKDSKNLDGNLELFYKNSNLLSSKLKGSFDNLDLNGNFLESEFLGNYSSNILKMYGRGLQLYNQKLPILKDFKGFLDQWSIDFSFDGIKFDSSSSYLEYQGIPIKNLVFKGEYKDRLNFNLKGNSYGVLWEIRGNGRERFSFDLALYPLLDFNLIPPQYIYLVESKWKGELWFGEEINVILKLREHKFPGVVEGNIEIKVKEKDWNLKGDFGLVDNGNLKLTLNSYGKGKLEGRSLPLSILKNLNILDISGDISMDFDLKDYSIENGNLNISNLNIPFLGKKIEGNLGITKDKEDYGVKGEIINLSKNKGLIVGKFNFNKFNFDITLPDSEFLYLYIPKDFIKDIDKGKIVFNISGDFKQWVSSGTLIFSSPINIPYVLDNISSINFKLKNQENKIFIESLNTKSFNSKITGSGEIYPNLNLNLKLKNLVLNVPGLFQGYSEWDINLKNMEGPLIEGKALIYNASISYSSGEKINKGVNKLPKIKLSLDLNLGANVNFYIPNTLNLGLKGNLKIYGDLSKPLLNGKIDFSRGNIQVLNRNFSVDFGYIKFPGLSFEENIWEISGSTIIQNYLVFLKAYGFMGQSSIYLTSSPPLSLREILFLILGQEKLALAKEETLPLYSLLEEIPIGFQSFLSGILAEYLLNPLFSEISRILNLESIKVQYALESFVPTWSKIIFEKKFSEDIIMRIDYSLEKGGFTSLELEYLLKSGLTIKWLTSGEGNNFFSFEYGVKF